MEKMAAKGVFRAVNGRDRINIPLPLEYIFHYHWNIPLLWCILIV